MQGKRCDNLALLGTPGAAGADHDGRVHVYFPLEMVPDISGSIGYILNSSSSSGSSSNTYSAATIVGNSDVYSQGAMGFPFLRFSSPDNSWKQQVSWELGGGFATDRQFSLLHPSLFGGAGYQARFPHTFGTNALPVYWMARSGIAMIDQPLMNSSGGVKLSSTGGFPEFHSTWVPAIETTIIVPLSSTFAFQAAVNAYFTDRPPASWNVTLAVSMDVANFAKSLGNLFSSEAAPSE
jgi:hypothetical protein